MYLIWDMPDKSVRYTHLTNSDIYNKYLSKPDGTKFTEEEFKQLIIKNTIPQEATNMMEVADDYLPTHEFRAAWRLIDGKLTYDFDQVKEIQLKIIRDKRNKLLDEQDRLMSRAVDLNDEKAKAIIIAKKNELRDATEQLKALNPTSIEEVKAAAPLFEGS